MKSLFCVVRTLINFHPMAWSFKAVIKCAIKTLFLNLKCFKMVIIPSVPLFNWFWDSPWPWTTHSSLPETRRHLPLFWDTQPVVFIALGWYIAHEGVPGSQGSNHWPSYINFNQEDTASFGEEESCSYFPQQKQNDKRWAAMKTAFSASVKKPDFLQVRCYSQGCDL